MGIHAFFTVLSKLERLNRCPGEFKTEDHSVASHSFNVAQFGLFMGELEERAGKAINWKLLFGKLIMHDVEEVWIGDIKSNVKEKSPELRKHLRAVAHIMSSEFIEDKIPDEFKDFFRTYLEEGKDESIEGKILALCDKIDLIYESYNEIRRGNPEKEYVEIYKYSLSGIKSVNILGSAYFIENILPEMLNEDSMAKVDIRALTEEILAK